MLPGSAQKGGAGLGGVTLEEDWLEAKEGGVGTKLAGGGSGFQQVEGQF